MLSAGTFISLQTYYNDGYGILEPDLLTSIIDCLLNRSLENISDECRFIFYIKDGVQQKVKVHTNDRGVLGFMVSEREKQLLSNIH